MPGDLVGYMLSLLWCDPASMLASMLHLLLRFMLVYAYEVARMSLRI